jgi:hypothetical protein
MVELTRADQDLGGGLGIGNWMGGFGDVGDKDGSDCGGGVDGFEEG